MNLRLSETSLDLLQGNKFIYALFIIYRFCERRLLTTLILISWYLWPRRWRKFLHSSSRDKDQTRSSCSLTRTVLLSRHLYICPWSFLLWVVAFFSLSEHIIYIPSPATPTSGCPVLISLKEFQAVVPVLWFNLNMLRKQTSRKFGVLWRGWQASRVPHPQDECRLSRNQRVNEFSVVSGPLSPWHQRQRILLRLQVPLLNLPMIMTLSTGEWVRSAG